MPRKAMPAKTWAYPVAGPYADRDMHPSKVPFGTFLRLRGIDGRYKGSLRTFPGFTLTIDLTDSPFDGTSFQTGTYDTNPYYYLPSIDNSSMTEIYFFMYLSVLVPEFNINGSSNTQGPQVIRGFVVAHDHTDGNVLRYYFYDDVQEQWAYHNLLREVDDYTDPYWNTITDYDEDWPWCLFDTDEPNMITSGAEYDVCAMGNTIMFTVNKDGSKENEGPIFHHRSILVDGLGVSERPDTSGSNPHYSVSLWYPTPIGPPDTYVGAGLGTSNPSIVGSVDHRSSPDDSQDLANFQVAQVSLSDTDKECFPGVRLFAKRKNVTGPFHHVIEGTSGDVDDTHDQKSTVDIQGQHMDATGGVAPYSLRRMSWCALDLELHGYRSLRSGIFNGAEVDGALVGSTQFRENRDKTLTDYPDSMLVSLNDHGSVIVNDNALTNPDRALVLQKQFNPNSEDTAFAAKRLKLLQPYQGTLLRIGTSPIPAYPEEIVDRDELLSWGSLTSYSPEQFRLVDSAPLGSSQDDTGLSIITAGDYAFVVGRTSVYRIHRNGVLLALNEVQSLAGGVSRWAACGMGTSLFYFADNGLYRVEGASGEFQLVTAVNRIVFDDWSDSLSSIRMVYDPKLGTIMALNTNLDEILLLWVNGGAITSLVDVPFVFCSNGIEPEGTDHVSFWALDNGKIFQPNSTRDSGIAFTMCGGDPSKDWNGTVTLVGGSPTTTFRCESSNGLDDIAEGFKVTFLTGDNAGYSRTISSIVSGGGDDWDIYVTGDAFPNNVAVGDIFSLAPIQVEVVGWPLQDREVGPDPFGRKVIANMAHVINPIAGNISTSSNDAWAILHHVYHRSNLDDPLPGSAVLANVDADQSDNFSYTNVGGTILFPAWTCRASNVDFEFLAGEVRGHVSASEAESARA